MPDSLVDSEIIGVWQRTKTYINVNNISATDITNMARQLKEAMMNPRKTNQNYPVNLDTLVDNNFANAFVANSEIRKELLSKRIGEVVVKGKTRYVLKQGTPTIRLRGGKNIQAGRFLPGRTKDEATENLRRYVDDEDRPPSNRKNQNFEGSGLEL